MKFEDFGVVTFESTHHALNGEKSFKDKDIPFKTIPTPREITLSCGLSLKFKLEDLDAVLELYSEEKVAIKGIYKFIMEDNIRKLIQIV